MYTASPERRRRRAAHVPDTGWPTLHSRASCQRHRQARPTPRRPVWGWSWSPVTRPVRDTRDDPVVLRERLAHHRARGRDLVESKLAAVLTAAHLDDRHHGAELAVDLDVALRDDVVGDEGDLLAREAHIGLD